MTPASWLLRGLPAAALHSAPAVPAAAAAAAAAAAVAAAVGIVLAVAVAGSPYWPASAVARRVLPDGEDSPAWPLDMRGQLSAAGGRALAGTSLLRPPGRPAVEGGGTVLSDPPPPEASPVVTAAAAAAAAAARAMALRAVAAGLLAHLIRHDDHQSSPFKLAYLC